MSDRKIVCRITGKSYTYGVDYFNTKVEEYQGIDNLKKFFITRKAKTLLNRGYTVSEIRNMLNVETDQLEPPDSPQLQELINYHGVMTNTRVKHTISSLNFTDHKSDPDVAIFINNIRNL